MNNDETNAFVFYRSFLDAVNALPEEYKYKTLMAIINYGLNGETKEDNPFIKAILTMVIPNIDCAKNRYEKAKENGAMGGEYGKYGGRPSKENNIIELYKSGVPKDEISSMLDISVRTIERAISKYKSRQNPTKPLNIEEEEEEKKKEEEDNKGKGNKKGEMPF